MAAERSDERDRRGAKGGGGEINPPPRADRHRDGNADRGVAPADAAADDDADEAPPSSSDHRDNDDDRHMREGLGFCRPAEPGPAQRRPPSSSDIVQCIRTQLRTDNEDIIMKNNNSISNASWD